MRVNEISTTNWTSPFSCVLDGVRMRACEPQHLEEHLTTRMPQTSMSEAETGYVFEVFCRARVLEVTVRAYARTLLRAYARTLVRAYARTLVRAYACIRA